MVQTANQATVQATESKGSYLFIVIRLCVLLILLCGILYPLVSTGIAQLLMPDRANGSLVKNSSGIVIGSELIGQSFKDQKYFHGRVSSIDYNAAASGSNNYGPSNPALIDRIKQSIEDWKSNNPAVPIDQVPVDLLTNSASGLDPDISPASAFVQVPRISALTGISEEQLKQLVKEHTTGRSLGLFGEERVHVLQLNLALDVLMQRGK
ncbi:potassium-transporting ATPase subunit KdpC [Paenibacillus albiflavus]